MPYLRIEAQRQSSRGSAARHTRAGLAAALASVAFLGAPAVVEAAPLRVAEVVMEGLTSPRGLTFGPGGGLFVAEAGLGGEGPAIRSGSGQDVFYGRTGGVSRLQNGTQQRVATDLPSLAGEGGFHAVGPQDVAFGADGGLYAVIGLGADPGVRSAGLAGEAGAELLGQLVKIEDGVAAPVADVADFEAAMNPAGDVIDSNPFSLVARPDGFAVSDAGANALLEVGEDGSVSLGAVFPPRDNPLSFGPPQFQSVPTGATRDAEGGIFVGELTGFPFPPGEARIYSLPEGEAEPLIFAGGLTNLIDLAFGPRGELYALTYDSNGLTVEGGGGALLSIGEDGSLTTLLQGLTNPTGLAIGMNGDFFISEDGLSPAEGRVLRVAPVPLPASLPIMATLLCAVVGWRFRARLC